VAAVKIEHVFKARPLKKLASRNKPQA